MLSITLFHLFTLEEHRSHSAVDLRNSEEVARVLSRVRSFNAAGEWIDHRHRRARQDGGSSSVSLSAVTRPYTIMEPPEGGLTMTTTVA